MQTLILLTYLSGFVFVFACLYRFIKIAKAPVHLRWELYPVPHERHKSSYGGSRLEEPDWWEKKESKDTINEVKSIATEILFLKGVWEHNKKLWTGSFPFHFALYLMAFNSTVLFVIAVIPLLFNAPDFNTNPTIVLISKIITILLWIETIIGTLGAFGLLYKRIADRSLRNMSNPSHYFNLISVGGIFVSGLIWLITDSNIINSIIAVLQSVLTYNPNSFVPGIAVYLHFAFVLFFLVYLPFTHMTHFFTKFFTYHKVRWDDELNLPGSKLEKRISECLNQTVTWSAPHIAVDGKNTWLTIVESASKKESKND